MVKLTVKIGEREIVLDVPEDGSTLLALAERHGFWMSHECMGQARCSQCRVVVEAGEEVLSPLEEKEADCLDQHGLDAPDIRLGCQAKVEKAGSLVIRVPPEPAHTPTPSPKPAGDG